MSARREIERIAQKQLAWQRENKRNEIFRSHFVFSGQKTKNYFFSKYSLSIEDFTLHAYALLYHYISYPILKTDNVPEHENLSTNLFKKTINIISNNIYTITKKLTLEKINSVGSYRKLDTRSFPCVILNREILEYELIACPIPDLLFLRFTEGIYYDVVGGGGSIRDEIGKKFEEYCNFFLSSAFPKFNFLPEKTYKRNRKQSVVTPDIRLLDNGEVRLIVECKANRMSFDNRFDVEATADQSVPSGLVKGVTQIWEYRRDVRIGKISDERPSLDILGLVLTFDPWLLLAEERVNKILDQALHQARKLGNFQQEDFCPIAFCEIADLEILASKASPTGFLKTIDEASRRPGWLLASIHNEIEDCHGYKEVLSDTQMGASIKWWNRIHGDES